METLISDPLVLISSCPINSPWLWSLASSDALSKATFVAGLATALASEASHLGPGALSCLGNKLQEGRLSLQSRSSWIPGVSSPGWGEGARKPSWSSFLGWVEVESLKGGMLPVSQAPGHLPSISHLYASPHICGYFAD